jgi:hypothetical protein
MGAGACLGPGQTQLDSRTRRGSLTESGGEMPNQQLGAGREGGG